MAVTNGITPPLTEDQKLAKQIRDLMKPESNIVKKRLDKFLGIELEKLGDKAAPEARQTLVGRIQKILNPADAADKALAEAIKPHQGVIQGIVDTHSPLIEAARAPYVKEQAIATALEKAAKLKPEAMLTQLQEIARTHGLGNVITIGKDDAAKTIKLAELDAKNVAENLKALGEHYKGTASALGETYHNAVNAFTNAVSDSKIADGKIGKALGTALGKWNALASFPERAWFNGGNFKTKGFTAALRDHFNLYEKWDFNTNALVENSENKMSNLKNVGIRATGVGVGSALVLDAFVRSQTSDKEDRSFTARLAEGTLGAAAVTAAALSGRARLPHLAV